MSDSGSMWANMLGLGPVLQAIQDPAFHAQVQGFVASVTDVRERVARIEAKLDFLISRMTTDGLGTALPVAVVFTELGADGVGACAVTGGAPDDGTGGAVDTAGGAGGGNRRAGARINGAAS